MPCCPVGGSFNPLLQLMEDAEDDEEGELHLPVYAPTQVIMSGLAPATPTPSPHEDLSWWTPTAPVTKTAGNHSGDVTNACITRFSQCKSLAAGVMSARSRFTTAMLRDRVAHSHAPASTPECMYHGDPNKNEVRINASLAYMSKLLKLKGTHKGASFTILVDDGSAINIISRKKVTELGLTTFSLTEPVAVSQFQGQHVDTCTEAVFLPIHVTDSRFKLQTINTHAPFIVVDMHGSFDMIFGMPVHEQFDLRKSYISKTMTFNTGTSYFTVHSYEKHLNKVQAAAVISHLAANHLSSTNQVAESFCVWVSLPSVPVFHTQASTDATTGQPPAQASPQPGGVGAPQPTAPHQPAVGSHLTPNQKAEVSSMLHSFSNLFAEPTGINPHLSPFHIKQKTGVPIRPFIRYARRLTLEERAIVQLTIDKFLLKGWIQPSDSEWGAPIMFIRKPDGSMRAVVDYRQLNSQSSSDGVKLPLLSDCLQAMANKQYYSKLDLADGYFQVPMHSDSIERTAFTTGDGRQFEWLVMPMGLKGAPNHFCRIMHAALKDLIKAKVCVVYLDDILIASDTFEQHIQHIHAVLAALSKVDLRAKPSKCQFAFKSVDFLGHHVGPDGIGTQPSKVDAIMSYPIPSCASHLDSFLGLVGFYSPLLPKLSTACALLRHKVLHWGDSFWTKEHQQAYDAVKQLVASAPFMHAVDPHKPFYIHLDASKVGAGATLSQDFGKGLQPVAYFSRKLLPYQTRYLNGKRELLALILACRQWRHWVGGAGVCVHAYTDHSNNAQLFLPSFSVSDTTIAGWLLELQRDYPGLVIHHVPGEKNQAADALSRNPDFLHDDIDLAIEVQPAPAAAPHTEPHHEIQNDIPTDDYTTPDQSDAYASCDSNRTSSTGSDISLPAPINNPYGYDANTWSLLNAPLGSPAPSHTYSTTSDSTNSDVQFGFNPDTGTYGFIGCVMSFQVNTLNPVFDNSKIPSPLYTSDSSLHDQFDTQVPPVFAFTGAALVLHPNAQLHGKFTHAYALDAYLSSHKANFAFRDGLYFRPNGALYVPAACIKLVMELEHDQGGHHGQAETERRVRRKYWWPNMHALIKEYVAACVLCGKSKPANHPLRAPLSFREFSDTPWEQISMDFVCGLPVVSGGYDRVLTVVDRGLTKRAHFIKCKSTHTAEHIAQLFLDYVYVHHGVPTSIITDQDPLFMSNFYKGLMSKLSVTLTPGAVYHPQSDGQSEVTNRILKSYLVKFCQDHPSQWHTCLFRAEFEYNYSQKTTGHSAFQLDMGRQPRRIEDVLINTESDIPAVQKLCDNQAEVIKSAKAALNRAFQLAAKQHDKKTRPIQVKVGDKVYLSTLHLNIHVPGGVRKFKQPYTGPFTITKMSSSGGAATLELPSSWLAARTWNVEYLKPYSATSSPVFDESADSLASLAVSDDSVRIGTENPVFSSVGGREIGSDTPMTDTTVGREIGPETPMTDTMILPDSGVSSEGMRAATKVVDRIGDYRPKRGSRPAQFLLIFKDQPTSESMWVATDECSVFSGFQAALSVHQGRRVLRSAS